MLRTVISLEPGGDQSRTRALAEITVVRLTSYASGRISADYAWRIRMVGRTGGETTAYGCLADSINNNAVELLGEVLAEWRSGRPHPIDNHGQEAVLITDHAAYWKRADPNPVEIPMPQTR